MSDTARFLFELVEDRDASPNLPVAEFQRGVDKVLGKWGSFAMADADLDLDAALDADDNRPQALRFGAFRFTGSHSTIRTVLLPARERFYIVWNNTTGDFDLTFQTVASGATSVNVPAGRTAVLVVDDSFNTYLFFANSVEVRDEGTLVLTNAFTLNFVGTDITATDAGGGVVDVTVVSPSPEASGTSFDDTTAGLIETDVQAALEALDLRVDGIEGGDVELVDHQESASAASVITFTGGGLRFSKYERLVCYLSGQVDSANSQIAMEILANGSWVAASIWQACKTVDEAGTVADLSGEGQTEFLLTEANVSDTASREFGLVIEITDPTDPNFKGIFTQGAYQHNDDAAIRGVWGGGQFKDGTNSIEGIRFVVTSPSGGQFAAHKATLLGIRNDRRSGLPGFEFLAEVEVTTAGSEIELISALLADPNLAMLYFEVDCQATTDDTRIGMEFSGDEGSSYLAASNDGGGRGEQSSGDIDADFAGASSHYLVSSTATEELGNATDETLKARIWMFGNDRETSHRYLFSHSVYTSGGAGSDATAVAYGGRVKTTSRINAVKITPAAGNITGRIRAYGMRKTQSVPGQVELISFQEVSGAADITVDDAKLLETDWVAWIVAGFLVPANDGVTGELHVSDDAGVSFNEAIIDYGRMGSDSAGTSLDLGNTNLDHFRITRNNMAGSDVGEAMAFVHTFLNPRGASVYKPVFANTVYAATDGDTEGFLYSYIRTQADALDQLKVEMSAGNIEEGWLAVWGVRSTKIVSVPTRVAKEITLDDPGGTTLLSANVQSAIQELNLRAPLRLQEETPSAQSTITLETGFDSRWDEVLIQLRGITLSVDGHLELEVRDSGGYKSTSYESESNAEDIIGGTHNDAGDTIIIRLISSDGTWIHDSAQATSSINLDITIKGIAGSVLYKQISWRGTYSKASNQDLVQVEGWAEYNGDANALTGVRLTAASASGITMSGTVRSWGIANG